jgi:ribosomal protein S3
MMEQTQRTSSNFLQLGAPGAAAGTPAKQGARSRIKKNNGVAFRFAGRAYGAKKAASFKMLVGSIPFNAVGTTMDYAQVTQKTRNGT